MATQVFISYRGDDSAGSTGRVHDGLVRRADDALLLGAPGSRKIRAPIPRSSRRRHPTLPSRPIEPPYVPRVPGARRPSCTVSRHSGQLALFSGMPALLCPRQPMTRDTTIASNKAETDLREFFGYGTRSRTENPRASQALVVFASQRRAVESCAVRDIPDTPR